MWAFIESIYDSLQRVRIGDTAIKQLRGAFADSLIGKLVYHNLEQHSLKSKE